MSRLFHYISFTEIKAGDSLSLGEVKVAFEHLSEKLMPSKLAADKIYNYPIHWDKEKGMPTLCFFQEYYH